MVCVGGCQVEWHEFRDGFVQGIENYINELLVKNDQTRSGTSALKCHQICMALRIWRACGACVLILLGICPSLCVCRATLHSFFRTEDNIFREMLLEEEQEGATWQQAQVQSAPGVFIITVG